MHQSTLRRLLGFAKPHWLYFLIGIFGALSVSGVDAFFARMIKSIVDHGLNTAQTHYVASLSLLLLGMFVVRGFASFFATYFINRIARTVVMVLRRALFDHLQGLPLSFYERFGHNNLVSLMLYNVEQISQASSQIVANSIQDIALVLGLLIVMFSVCWPLALLFSVMAPLILLVARYASRRSRHLNRTVQGTISKVTKSLTEVFRGVREVRVYGAEAHERERFWKETKANQAHTLKVVVTKAFSSSVIQLLVAVPIVLSLWFASMDWFKMTAGSFASVLTAMVMIIRPLRRLSQANTDIQQGLAGADSVFEILDAPLEDRSGVALIKQVLGNIAFENVSHAYSGQEELSIKDVSFTVKSGAMVALVGPSGSGKTTLMQLLMRFYEPQSGLITLDGQAIQSLSLKDYWAQFSLVTQAPMLFHESIAYNVTYGSDGDIDSQRLENSLKAAQLWDKVSQLPKGVDSCVGEDGSTLSGGEKQRLALARAFYKNAPLVVLDEATSALDTPTERLIQSAIETLRDQSTLFVIAHRLSTVEHADHILVMNNGSLLDQGTHDDLFARCDLYRSLCQHDMELSDS